MRYLLLFFSITKPVALDKDRSWEKVLIYTDVKLSIFMQISRDNV